MAIQPMALSVANPQIDSMNALGQGVQARQTFDSNNIAIAQKGLETIGSMALGAMGGDLKGQADPALFEQGLDMLAAQGIKVDEFRGKPQIAPLVAQASMTAMQQLQNARSEDEFNLSMQRFQADLQQAAKGTANMQDYALTQEDPGYAEFLQGGKKAPAEPTLTTKYDENGREQRGYMGPVDAEHPDGFYNVGSPKATTERPEFNVSQAAAAGYADRMIQSDAILSSPELATVQLDRGQQIKSGTPIIGNDLVSPEYRQADQARRDFINAILRRESGAVISDGEFANANKQYFPQPGDDEATLRQKAANRNNAIKGISRQAGPAYAAPDTANYLKDPAALGEDAGGSSGDYQDGTVIENDNGDRLVLRNGEWVNENG